MFSTSGESSESSQSFPDAEVLKPDFTLRPDHLRLWSPAALHTTPREYLGPLLGLSLSCLSLDTD